jgi:hypothetical protein
MKYTTNMEFSNIFKNVTKSKIMLLFRFTNILKKVAQNLCYYKIIWYEHLITNRNIYHFTNWFFKDKLDPI